MCIERLFSHGGRPLCTQILPGQGRLRSTILRQKTRDNGLPDGEDRIPLRSLVLTQYRSVTDRQTDRQADRRICRSIYSACKASFAARCKNQDEEYQIRMGSENDATIYTDVLSFTEKQASIHISIGEVAIKSN